MKAKAFLLTAVSGAAALALPSAAHAQDVVPGQGFIGVQAGVHTLGLEDEFASIAEGAPIELDDSSPLIGVFAGYDFPLGPSMFAGIEGNYNFGTDAIDADYGASVRLGTRLPGGAKLYARGGYQAVKLDFNGIFNTDEFDFDEFDDTEGDYLVGIGADVPIGNMFVRANLDTISFDTMRATAGVGFKF